MLPAWPHPCSALTPAGSWGCAEVEAQLEATPAAILESTDILRADVSSCSCFRALDTFALRLGLGYHLMSLPKCSWPQRSCSSVREFTGNRMWDTKVKGSIKEILHKHHADPHLALPLPRAGFAGVSDRPLSYEFAVSGCRQDICYGKPSVSGGTGRQSFNPERCHPKTKLLGPGQVFVGQCRASAIR